VKVGYLVQLIKMTTRLFCTFIVLSGVMYGSVISANGPSPRIAWIWGVVAGLCLSCLPVLGDILQGFGSQAKSLEPYSLDHLLLNLNPSNKLWLNMGYWKNTKDFTTACESLALKLAAFMDLGDGAKILDVGFGCGESVVLWADRFLPASIHGVTSLKSQHAIALKKVEQIAVLPPQGIHLWAGDAIKSLQSQLTNSYDAVIAVDSCYHFKTRNVFLSESFRTLQPGGKLGVTDLIPPSLGWFSFILLRVVCFIASVPWTNMISKQKYLDDLTSIGFIDVEIEDISAHVFQGLADFISDRDTEPWFDSMKDWKGWTQFVGFSKFLRWWSTGKMHFVLVRATKPAE